MLHKHVLSDLLCASAASSLPSYTSLDALLGHSSSILSASDEVVATLYSPQEPASISSELASFIDIVRRIDKWLGEFWSVEQQICHLYVDDQKDLKKKAWKKRGFDTCLKQIYNSAEALTCQVDVEGPKI
jgi:hypothetical protein